MVQTFYYAKGSREINEKCVFIMLQQQFLYSLSVCWKLLHLISTPMGWCLLLRSFV